MRTDRAKPQWHFESFATALLCLLFTPLLIGILRDRRAFSWDEAFYAASSVSLFQTLLHAPLKWPAEMLRSCIDRPPAIAWIGQFFVPFGRALPYVQTALLLFVLATSVSVTLLLYRALRRLFGPGLPALITASLAASGPLLNALTDRYFVEPLQLLSVVWLLVVAAYYDRLNRMAVALHVTAAVAFGLLVKTSTPAFQGPIVLYLAYLMFRKPSQHDQAERWNSRGTIAVLVAAVVLTFGAAGWYAVNYQAAFQHVADATSGSSFAGFYGGRGSLGTKLNYWTGNFQKAFFWEPLLIFVASMLPVAPWQRWKVKGGLTRADALALISFVWIGTLLVLFARNTNEDTRYLLALLPYLSIVVCWVFVNLPYRGLVWTFAALTAAQFVIVTAVGLGGIAPQAGLNAYLTPFVTDPTALRDSIWAARQTADCTFEHRAIVGTELSEFNSVGLTFYSALQGHRFDGNWRYVGNDFTQTDPNKIWDGLLSGQCRYYVYRKYPASQNADIFNHLSSAVYEKVAASTLFKLRPDKSNDRVLVYERSLHGRPRYRVASTTPALSAPIEGGFQSVQQAPGLPFGFVDNPKLGSPAQSTDSLRIDGWAAAEGTISRVEVLLDGKFIQNALPAARPDVVSAYPNMKTMGFTASLNLTSVTDGLHRVSLGAHEASGASRIIALIPVLRHLEFSGVNPDRALPFGLLEYPSKDLLLQSGDPMRVLGWTASPLPVKRVEILVDGNHSIYASLMSRPDVAKAYPKLATSGFSADLNLNDVPGGLHKISAIEFTGNASRQLAEVSFLVNPNFQSVAPKDSLPFGALDLPAPNSTSEGLEFLPFAGWAASPSGIGVVEVLIDGRVFAKAAGTQRPDVEKAFPGMRIAAFNDRLDLSSIPEGPHQLSLVAHNLDGSSRTICRLAFIRDVN